MNHAGECHCGNIHVLLRLSKPPERTPVRTCTCSFCRSHNPRMISDPGGLLELSADDWSLVELYRFGTRTADFVIPTGGYKRSGIGKDLGRQAYEANLRFKSVLVDFAAPSPHAPSAAGGPDDSNATGAA